MFQALVRKAIRFLSDLDRSASRKEIGTPEAIESRPARRVSYRPLKRAVLTDGVGKTLFEEYAAHRAGEQGQQETGWFLLGLREEEEAIALAALPAGKDRDAGPGHILFSSEPQALGSRVLRQADRRLMMLGVVHTHPGSLRHPSEEDYRGDISWVGQLRGKEGIFAIGTADNKPAEVIDIAQQPRHNVQCFGPLRFTWYALAEEDTSYRPLSVAYTLGPDLARPLHQVWPILEAHASRLERLCQQQAGVRIEVVNSEGEPALSVCLRLAGPAQFLRILIDGKGPRYFVQRQGQEFAANPQENGVDRAAYLLLAELAAGAL
jgi:proteasome lid subunit RPN8/RPN11